MSDKLSYKVIGLGMQVHRELGPGVDETFYHDLLSDYLTDSGIAHASHVRSKLLHRGIAADEFEADLLIQEGMIIELKCLDGGFAPEHYLQMFCYLKHWKLPTGLLFDFGKESLLYRRVNAPQLSSERFEPFAGPVGEALDRILREHGLGYRDTTYRGLLAADLRAEGIQCEVCPTTVLTIGTRKARHVVCNCLLVDKNLCVFVRALRKRISAADIAVTRNYARLLRATSGVVVNFGKTAVEHQFIQSLSVSNLWT